MWTPEETARALLALLPLLSRLMLAELRPDAHENTTMPQFRVLGYLLDAPLTLSEIARRRRVSLQSAGELVQSLVDQGWISRVPDERDRRQIQLHLTETGRQQYHQASRRMVARLIPLAEQLTPEEIAAIQLALPALERVLAGDVTDETPADE